jgi:hypothetical protein
MLNKNIQTRFGLQAGHWRLRNVDAWRGRCIVYVDLFADKASADAGMEAVTTKRFEFDDELPIDITANVVIARIRNAMRKLPEFSDATDED